MSNFKIECYAKTIGEQYAFNNGFEYTLIGHTHNFNEWVIIKEPTCTENGINTRSCDGCLKTETKTINALGHDYSTAWTTDTATTCGAAGSKSHHCTRCSAKKDVTAIPATGKHTFSEWNTAKAATCTTAGTQTRTCSVCGKVETQTIAKTDHKYVNTVVKSTYTAKGYTLHKCSVCGASYKDNYTAKLTLSKVTNFKAKSISSTNVTLQWTKNSAVSGYEIEQYKGGKWVNVAKITSNATTSYTIKGLKAGTAGYQFRIRAYRTEGKNKAYSGYSSIVKVNTNPYGVGGFKCSSKSSTSVTLKWNKGTTASGYQLQQYKNGKWVTIYTANKATNTSYTVKKLKAGTAGYRFRIRAYKTYGNTKQYGSWSSEVKVNTNPYGVGGFKAKSTAKTSITLGWNKGTTASGYQLQQYKGGKWVTVYTGTKATSTSYTVKSLKA
ncbi:MAG: fibronectin type III domain-containing protein, partial [Ruminiclostridium sp.]|nr:fibronectin type III domain-containing protein [Ruminiclostridium sp.]